MSEMYPSITKIDLAEPGIRQMFTDGRNYEAVVKAVAKAVLDYKWKVKPAKVIVDEVIKRMAKEIIVCRNTHK